MCDKRNPKHFRNLDQASDVLWESKRRDELKVSVKPAWSDHKPNFPDGRTAVAKRMKFTAQLVLILAFAKRGPLLAVKQLMLSLYDREHLIFPVVDMRRRTAAGRGSLHPDKERIACGSAADKHLGLFAKHSDDVVWFSFMGALSMVVRSYFTRESLKHCPGHDSLIHTECKVFLSFQNARQRLPLMANTRRTKKNRMAFPFFLDNLHLGCYTRNPY